MTGGRRSAWALTCDVIREAIMAAAEAGPVPDDGRYLVAVPGSERNRVMVDLVIPSTAAEPRRGRRHFVVIVRELP